MQCKNEECWANFISPRILRPDFLADGTPKNITRNVENGFSWWSERGDSQDILSCDLAYHGGICL